MTSVRKSVLLFCFLNGACWAARCTTIMEPSMMREYQAYVAATEKAMGPRFDSGELAWVPAPAQKEAAARLGYGHSVRWNISDPSLNRRLANQNGTILHWVGAVRIAAATLADLASVLDDYPSYNRIYRPMVWQCKTASGENIGDGSDRMTLGLHSAFRVASLFPQHYSFEARARIERPEAGSPGGVLRMHIRSEEIRESDSGVPGRNDLLDPYHDHGIMWALNAYWRARQQPSGVYLEFESITLARSVQSFACKIGFVPIPRSVISAAMDSIPSESVTTVLEGTQAECERRLARKAAEAARR